MLAPLVSLYYLGADLYMDYIANMICLIYQYFIQQQYDQIFWHFAQHNWISTLADIYLLVQGK